VEFRVEVHPDDATALVLRRHTNTMYENIIPDEPTPPKTTQELEARQILLCFFGTEFFATLLPFVGFEIVAISSPCFPLVGSSLERSAEEIDEDAGHITIDTDDTVLMAFSRPWL